MFTSFIRSFISNQSKLVFKTPGRFAAISAGCAIGGFAYYNWSNKNIITTNASADKKDVDHKSINMKDTTMRINLVMAKCYYLLDDIEANLAGILHDVSKKHGDELIKTICITLKSDIFSSKSGRERLVAEIYRRLEKTYPMKIFSVNVISDSCDRVLLLHDPSVNDGEFISSLPYSGQRICYARNIKNSYEFFINVQRIARQIEQEELGKRAPNYTDAMKSKLK